MNYLKLKRGESGYLSRKVAKDFGISRSTLYRKENGKTKLTQAEIEKFAKYYDVEEEEIKKNYKVAR